MFRGLRSGRDQIQELEDHMAGRKLLVVALGTLALASCGGMAATAGGSSTRITREQLEALESISAYDAIQRLRPTWLQARGPVSLSGGNSLPRVHINDSRLSTLDELRSLLTHQVEAMEYRNAADATTLYGTGYPGGVIEVRTRR
jgi:hypothetical protein